MDQLNAGPQDWLMKCSVVCPWNLMDENFWLLLVAFCLLIDPDPLVNELMMAKQVSDGWNADKSVRRVQNRGPEWAKIERNDRVARAQYACPIWVLTHTTNQDSDDSIAVHWISALIDKQETANDVDMNRGISDADFSRFDRDYVSSCNRNNEDRCKPRRVRSCWNAVDAEHVLSTRKICV